MGNGVVSFNNSDSYTLLDTSIFDDERLTWTALGVLGCIASQPQGYQTTEDELCASSPKDDPREVALAVNTLVECGYLAKDERGQLCLNFS